MSYGITFWGQSSLNVIVPINSEVKNTRLELLEYAILETIAEIY